MATSEAVKRMNSVIASAAIAKYLKNLGYRKQAHTFNKICEPGLVHVIQFQMGAYQVGTLSDAPPYRKNLYGRFTVNLSVFISEVREITFNEPPSEPKTFITEAKCQIRNRLGFLLPAKWDRWWDLAADIEELSESMNLLLDSYGMPYLANYTSREATVKHLIDQRSTAMNYGLFLAIMLWKRGEKQAAETILTEEFQKYEVERPNFANYIRKLAERMKLQVTA